VEIAASIILNFLKSANYDADDDLFKGPDALASQFADANGTCHVHRQEILFLFFFFSFLSFSSSFVFSLCSA
jgi:hypothetical protein